MNERRILDHQTPPSALIGALGEISELPQERSDEDTAEKFALDYPRIEKARLFSVRHKRVNTRIITPQIAEKCVLCGNRQVRAGEC